MSSGSSAGGGRSTDLKSSELRGLFNEKVTHVQEVTRSVGSSGGSGSGQGGLSHSGMLINTEGGGKYLVHKGDGYGNPSQTVVTDSRNMKQSNWSHSDVREVSGKHTVSDYVNAGGKDYKLLTDNCNHATKRMGQLD